MYHARVLAQPGAVALHVFGTPNGTCPPGSALSALGRDSAAADGAPGASSAKAAGDPAADGPFGLSFNGSVIDLSSSFQPE